MVETFGREAKARRELPQAGAELFLEPQHARGKEVGERRLDVAQPPDMGDEPRALDREDKAVGGLVIPPGKSIGALQPVERAVDFDRVDLSAGVGEFIGLYETWRIEISAPRPVGPAGDPDPHGARLA